MDNLHKFKAMLYSSDPLKTEVQLGKALKETEEYAKIAISTKRIVVINVIEVEKLKFSKPKDRTALGLNRLNGTCAET